MNAKVEKALNEQVHAEFFSFYLYLSVAAYFTANHLDGFAHWMRIQAQEEFAHAMKLFDFLNERGGTVELLPLEAPTREWASPSDAVEAVLEALMTRVPKLYDLLGDNTGSDTSARPPSNPTQPARSRPPPGGCGRSSR